MVDPTVPQTTAVWSAPVVGRCRQCLKAAHTSSATTTNMTTTDDETKAAVIASELEELESDLVRDCTADTHQTGYTDNTRHS